MPQQVAHEKTGLVERLEPPSGVPGITAAEVQVAKESADARLELNIMFEEIIPRLRNPRLQGEAQFVRSFFQSNLFIKYHLFHI